MGSQRVLGLVLAGGAGTRLWPLTAGRATSAVPFGGVYRVVDFALSNLVNGGLQHIYVLTQYKSHSLNKHVTTTWRLSTLLDNYVTPVPAQQRLGPRWQAGSADAIYQSLNLIHSDRPDLIVVVGADHVYRMDPRQMIKAHLSWGAGATVAVLPIPRNEAAHFGVARTAPDGHLIEMFMEKPSHPPDRPGQPDEVLVSMGNYVFNTDVLVEALQKDAEDGTAGTASAATSSRGWSRSVRRTPMTSGGTRCPAPRRATRVTGGKWGRSTPTSMRTWTCARSTRRSTSTTAGGRS